MTRVRLAVHRTFEPVMKLFPFTVRVKAPEPASTLDGFKVVVAGAGLLMVNWEVFEVPPPGEALTTVTFAVPAETTSPAGMEAVT